MLVRCDGGRLERGDGVSRYESHLGQEAVSPDK